MKMGLPTLFVFATRYLAGRHGRLGLAHARTTPTGGGPQSTGTGRNHDNPWPLLVPAVKQHVFLVDGGNFQRNQ